MLGTGLVLGVLIPIQKFYKLRAETEKIKAEAGKAKAETAKLTLETLERYRQLMEQAPFRTQLDLIKELASKLKSLGVELDVTEVHKYLSEEQKLFEPLKRLHGGAEERKEIIKTVVDPLEHLKEIEIVKIKFG